MTDYDDITGDIVKDVLRERRFSAKPPKKYADKDRTRATQEWLDWREDFAEAEISAMGPGSHETYFPDLHGKAIPDEGCWIRVLIEPLTELQERFQVPLQSMWRARRHEVEAGERWGLRPQQAVIVTPGGELHLWPYEYGIVSDITQYVGMEPDVTMHTLGGDPLFSDDMEEQLFYLQSRGISRREAAMLLLNDINAQGFCYFTLDPEYAEYFRGVGVPLWYYVASQSRTLEAVSGV